MNIGKENRPVKFGINQSIIFCKLRGITISKMSDVIDNIVKNEVDGSEVRDFLYSALKDGARKEKQTFDFTPEDVGDWMEDVDLEELESFFLGFIDSQPKTKRKASKKK